MLRTLRSIFLSAAAIAIVGVVVAGAAGADAPARPASTAASGVELEAFLAADQPSARPDRVAGRADLRRFAAWRRLVHATVVVDLPDKGLTTVQLDRGTISAVEASSVTIAEAGGGSVTVKLTADTRVRRDGKRAAIGDLKTGDAVFAISTVAAGAATADLVVVPRR